MSKENGSTMFELQNKDVKVKLEEVEVSIKEQKSTVEDLEKKLKEAREALEKSQDEKIRLLMIIKGKSREDIIKYLAESKNTLEEELDKTLTDSSKKELEDLSFKAKSLSQTIIDRKESVPFGSMIKDAVAEKADENKKFVDELITLLNNEKLPQEKTISEIKETLTNITKEADEVIAVIPAESEVVPTSEATSSTGGSIKEDQVEEDSIQPEETDYQPVQVEDDEQKQAVVLTQSDTIGEPQSKTM